MSDSKARRDVPKDGAYIPVNEQGGEDCGLSHEIVAMMAKMWTAVLLPKLRPGCEVSARDAMLCMVQLKASHADHAGLLAMLGDYEKESK